MATYFAGGGFDCWAPAISGCTDNATSVTCGGSGYADAYLRDPATGAFTTSTSLWFHGNVSGNSSFGYGASNIIEFYNASGVNVVRLRSSTSPAAYYLEWYDGSSWHSALASAPAANINDFVDIQIIIAGGTGGYIGWYVGSALAAELSGIDTSSMGAIAYARFLGIRAFGGTSGTIDGGLIASYSTIGHTVRRRGATANGSEQQWTGSYTDINETSTNDATAITANANNLVSNFTAGALSPTVTGSVIKCVAVGARGRALGGAPTRVAAILTLSSVDYVGPAFTDGAGYTPLVTCFDVDPSTGVPWVSITPVNGTSFGVKALA